MWGYLLVGFVGMWLFQFYLTTRQMKHYRRTIQEMSERDSGYLGVGAEKKKLGAGTVLVLVTNSEGIIEECRVMNGVTVFAKFEKCKRFTGRHLTEVHDDKWAQPLKMAVEKIQHQMRASEPSYS